MPPVDIPWKGFCFETLCFSPSKYSFVFLVYTRLYLYFSSLLSFLLIQFSPFFPSVGLLLCLRQAFYGGSAGRTTKPQDDTHSLDTHCIQLTLRTQSLFYTHKELTHTHNPLLTDLTQTSTQTAWAPLHSVSVWQILNISNYFAQVSSQIGFLRRSPTAQEAQREDDKLSIRAGSGEFSSCLHTLRKT